MRQSRISFTQTQNGEEIVADPLGLGACQLWVAAALGCVFCVGGLGAAAIMILYQQALGVSPWFVSLPLLFAAVGLGSILFAIQFAWCRTVIVLSGKEVRVTKNGPLGGRRSVYQQADIKSIEVGESCLRNGGDETGGGRALLQIQLRLRNGTQQTFLTGYEESELQSVARILQCRLATERSGD